MITTIPDEWLRCCDRFPRRSNSVTGSIDNLLRKSIDWISVDSTCFSLWRVFKIFHRQTASSVYFSPGALCLFTISLRRLSPFFTVHFTHRNHGYWAPRSTLNTLSTQHFRLEPGPGTSCLTVKYIFVMVACPSSRQLALHSDTAGDDEWAEKKEKN